MIVSDMIDKLDFIEFKKVWNWEWGKNKCKKGEINSMCLKEIN